MEYCCRTLRMDKDCVEKLLVESIDQLLSLDNYLLEKDVNERSISHRLAVYIEKHFPDWDVDCEYNRDHDDSKRLNLEPGCIKSGDLQATTVFPDIIIHKRGTKNNFIVIEMKKDSRGQFDCAYDIRKLQAFKDKLGYKFAIFIKVKTGADYDANVDRWIEDDH